MQTLSTASAATKKFVKDTKVLVVDDTSFSRLMLKQLLSEYGFTHIFEAEDGKSALELTRELLPDIVLLDINMPVMNGLEYCKFIRKDPKLKNIPVLVQTGLTESRQKTEIFEAGASDYIAKPIDKSEVIARVFTHLERSMLLGDLQGYKNRVQEELNAAKTMQDLLMPKQIVVEDIYKTLGTEIEHYFKTSSEMGGDFWNCDLLSKHELAVSIVDFSGHGVTAALNIFRLHTIMKNLRAKAKNPGKFLTDLNKDITALLSIEQYATMFYGIIDTKKNELRYACASCPAPVIFYKNSEKSTLLDSKNFPIGVKKDVIYETKSIPFNKGDLLFLYSDALIETENSKGKTLSLDYIIKLKNKLNKQKTPSPGKLFFEHLLALFNKEYSKKIRDDLTITLYQRN